MIKTGDIVICIAQRSYFDDNLTIGKKYEVLNVWIDMELYLIVDDYGKRKYTQRHCFITISKLREQKLKQILK